MTEPTMTDSLDVRAAFSGDCHPADDEPRPRPRPAWLCEAVNLARQFREPSPPDADAGTTRDTTTPVSAGPGK
jgi:hypothetical protein